MTILGIKACCGYPEGAPSKVCESNYIYGRKALFPAGHGAEPRKTAFPFQIKTTPSEKNNSIEIQVSF